MHHHYSYRFPVPYSHADERTAAPSRVLSCRDPARASSTKLIDSLMDLEMMNGDNEPP